MRIRPEQSYYSNLQQRTLAVGKSYENCKFDCHDYVILLYRYLLEKYIDAALDDYW